MMIDLKNVNPELVAYEAVEGVPMVDLSVPEQLFKAEPASPKSESLGEATPVPEGNMLEVTIDTTIADRFFDLMDKEFEPQDQIQLYLVMKFATQQAEEALGIVGVNF